MGFLGSLAQQVVVASDPCVWSMDNAHLRVLNHRLRLHSDACAPRYERQGRKRFRKGRGRRRARTLSVGASACYMCCCFACMFVGICAQLLFYLAGAVASAGHGASRGFREAGDGGAVYEPLGAHFWDAWALGRSAGRRARRAWAHLMRALKGNTRPPDSQVAEEGSSQLSNEDFRSRLVCLKM